MARLIYGLNQSLDGNVGHDALAPGPKLFRHFIDRVSEVAGGLYGGRMYGIMRYWDEDQEGWSEDEHAYARAWRKMPKRVASRSLTEVGPNATLLDGDLAQAVRTLKESEDGTFDVAGPGLAALLGKAGLIDAWQIYLHPVVAGPGTTFFGDFRPELRLDEVREMGEGVVRLTYLPA